MLNTFKAFLDDKQALEMYITGRAGTGKTTDVAGLVAYCLANEIECTVSAFTHKAVGILASKMPEGTNMRTLHSFLGKRPTINQGATKRHHIESSQKHGKTGETTILFIDEYSMVGEKDFMDIMAEEKLKVVWIGDPYQLPPVGDAQTVKPRGKYQVLLTEVKRRAKDNPLGQALEQLVSYIEGAPIRPLIESSHFKRGCNLEESYNACDDPDRVILAYTNKNVQELNATIQGYTEPRCGDMLFSPTTQKPYEFVRWVEYPDCIQLPFGDPLLLGSKFKTLEHVIKMGVKFAELIDDEGDVIVMAIEFGHYDFKVSTQIFKEDAAAANADVDEHAPGVNIKKWCYDNKSSKLAKDRAKAWRNFLSYNECVVCIDFAHAMTVHKSQGSTYKTVFVDTNDLYKAAAFDPKMYLKLMYVALSRASLQVITN